MKTIAVVATRYTDWMSNLVACLTGSGYSHVALALDEKLETMYSFNLKGFSCETLAKYRRHGVTKSRSYFLHVSDHAYEQLMLRIRRFEKHREEYRYAMLGVWLSFFNISFVQRGRYFCSHFVAEALVAAGAMPLKHKPARYLPHRLMRELTHSVQLCRIQQNPAAAV